MTILFIILKIIGILLLAILGILIVTILLVLFHPVSYWVKADISDDIVARGKVFWLFHILGIHFSWNGEDFLYEFRIFGIRKKRKEDAEIEEDDEESVVPKQKKNPDKERQPSEELASEEQPSEGCNSEEQLDEEQVSKERPKEKQQKEIQVRGTRKKEKQSLWKKLVRKIKAFVNKIKHVLISVIEAIKNLRQKGSLMIELLSDEANQKTVKSSFGELLYLLKHFKIRKISSDLTFSMSDPAWTGQALGMLSMIPYLYQKGVGIYPDFEAEQFFVRGNFEIEGHARGIHVIISVIRMWKDKNFRKMIKKFI